MEIFGLADFLIGLARIYTMFLFLIYVIHIYTHFQCIYNGNKVDALIHTYSQMGKCP